MRPPVSHREPVVFRVTYLSPMGLGQTSNIFYRSSGSEQWVFSPHSGSPPVRAGYPPILSTNKRGPVSLCTFSMASSFQHQFFFSFPACLLLFPSTAASKPEVRRVTCKIICPRPSPFLLSLHSPCVGSKIICHLLTFRRLSCKAGRISCSCRSAKIPVSCILLGELNIFRDRPGSSKQRSSFRRAPRLPVFLSTTTFIQNIGFIHPR